MAKGSKPRVRGRVGPISSASLTESPKSAKWVSGNDLYALCLLCAHLMVFFGRGIRERKISIPENERMTIDRREPRERRGGEIFIK
jgi:hypothetical protein